MRIDPDAWDDWLGSPITEAFMQFCRVKAEEQKARWLQVSWDGGQSDPTTLARLQERSITLEEITRLTREDLEE
jgi:hypothetical protein